MIFGSSMWTIKKEQTFLSYCRLRAKNVVNKRAYKIRNFPFHFNVLICKIYLHSIIEASPRIISLQKVKGIKDSKWGIWITEMY